MVHQKDVQIKREIKGTLEVTIELHNGGALISANKFTKQFNKRYT